MKECNKETKKRSNNIRNEEKNTGAQNCGDYFNIFLSAESAKSCFMSNSINQEENGENMLPPAIFPI
jgi:hypothetical protein